MSVGVVVPPAGHIHITVFLLSSSSARTRRGRPAASVSGGQERSWQPTQRLRQPTKDKHRTHSLSSWSCVSTSLRDQKAERTRNHNGGGPAAVLAAKHEREHS